MKKKETAEDRVQKILDFKGVEVINLVIERHNLSELNRTYFVVRFAEEDESKEKEYTREMDEIREKINLIDEKLFNKGIEKKERLQILRDIKKAYPNGWEQGFVAKK